jgi:hypothetical protein
MRNWIILLTAISALAEVSMGRKHPLIKLNNANWQDMVGHHDLLLVLFHSSDNAHSNGIREELEHYQKSLDFQNSRLNIAELDCYDFEPIKRNMGVEFNQIPFVSFILDKKVYTLKKKLPSVLCLDPSLPRSKPSYGTLTPADTYTEPRVSLSFKIFWREEK